MLIHWPSIYYYYYIFLNLVSTSLPTNLSNVCQMYNLYAGYVSTEFIEEKVVIAFNITNQMEPKINTVIWKYDEYMLFRELKNYFSAQTSSQKHVSNLPPTGKE